MIVLHLISFRTDMQYSGKVILVGPSGVGKTSLLNRYVTGTFDQNSIPTVSPTAVQVSIPVEDQISVELALWDTAGQEKFQSISQMFYRGSNVAIICILSNQINEIEKWANNIKDVVPECIIMIAITKIDLLSPEQQSEAMHQIEPYLTQFNIQESFLTSSETGEGIKMLFVSVAQAIYMAKQKSVEIIQKDNDNKVILNTEEETSKNCC